MKKRLVALVLCLVMVLGCTVARAEDVFSKFQPCTTVDLSVFKDAGYTSSYDEYAFTAELYPRTSKISQEVAHRISDSTKTTCTVNFDLKLVYVGGNCFVTPRMIFSRSGMYVYACDRMTDIYIKNGENRYLVDVSGCSRSSSSKSYTATDTSVEPMHRKGTTMLADLAHSTYAIDVSFDGDSSCTMTLTEDDKKAISDFYDTCLKAGVFDQDTLYSFEDDYSILTLFNPGSEGTEDVVTEEPSTPENSET